MMHYKIIDRVSDLEDLEWDVPGIPDYRDSPESELQAIKAFEEYQRDGFGGEARKVYREVLPNFYR